MTTEINDSIAKKSAGGIQWIPIFAAILFCYMLYTVPGASFTVDAEDAEKSYDTVQTQVEGRAAGRSLAEIAPLLGLGFLALLLQFHRRGEASKVWSRAYPLVVVLGFCLLSVLWSAFPDIALRRVIKHLLYMIILAGIVVGADTPRDIHRLAIFVTGVLMMLNIASVVVIPAAAVDPGGAFTGLYGHKNTAGSFAMISVFTWLSAALWSEAGYKRILLYLGVLLWFAFLIGTNSRTSLAATVLAIAMIVPLRIFVKGQLSFILTVLGGIFVLLLAIFVLNLLNVQISDVFGTLEGDKTTLTGRTTIWRIVYEVFLQHMLLGVGYGSLWGTGGTTIAEVFGNQQVTLFLIGLNQAHNGYVDVLATLGMIGSVIFVAFLVSAVVRAIKALISAEKATADLAIAGMCGFVFIGVLVHNFAETSFLRGNLSWVYFVLCYFMLCVPRGEDASEAE